MNKERIIYIPIAKSIPEFSKRDGTPYTCTLGYSPQKGLIRVYPAPLKGMDKWHIYNIPLEKNKRDSRRESYKLSTNSRYEDFISISKDVQLIDVVKDKTIIINELMKNIYPSISKMNEARVSIGVIRTSEYKAFWEANDKFIDNNQVGLFEEVEIASWTVYTKDSKTAIAKCIFRDGDGIHTLQLNEWQFYEYQRKFGVNNDAFRHIKGSNEKLLLLGNMNAYRNNWIVLGVFNPIHQTFLF